MSSLSAATNGTYPKFVRLNEGWNADPNAPIPRFRVSGDQLIVTFHPNVRLYPRFNALDRIALVFSRCSRFRFTPVNDHGWYEGQCRFSKVAPKWGEFYEIIGDTLDDQDPTHWKTIGCDQWTKRHFHFYFRDDAFECKADGFATLFDEALVAQETEFKDVL